MTIDEKNMLSVEITAARQMLNAVPFADATQRKFISLLDDLPYEDCSEAIDRFMKDPETRFPPTPADIRRICLDIAEDRRMANYKPYLARHPEEIQTPEQRKKNAELIERALARINRVEQDEAGDSGFTVRKAEGKEDQ